ncbi:MAG: type I DNA topoisomerase [Lachnospiraceae bacterium]|nr:type I DNA topoisomerase [Lachnospiraceae bacterium]
MAKNLVIVESPAKVKTIKKFLGSGYDVQASMGHVRDLPKSTMGIDIENDYEPKYITIRGKGELLAGLRKAAKNADRIYLATDPDREGEAISWHLGYALKLDPAKTRRVTFNEITKTAVKDALKHPRDIDMNLVDAQQSRRILDRMVGYSISPVLWAKVKRGLSAGRVQSAALRMIGDREDEINAFVPSEYWSLDVDFAIGGSRKKMTAAFYGKDKKMTIGSKAELDQILADLEGADFAITDVKRSERVRKAPLPFTTSTLQQEAAKTLNFTTSKTMRIAQQLYEGVDVKGSGSVGLITYLRTDSTRISDEADQKAREYVAREYGEEAVGTGTAAARKGNVQDAHEAIRPTDIERTPVKIKESLSRDQFRLYQLIWRRFVASRMAPAVYDTVSVKIGGAGYTFTAPGSYLRSAGFMNVYTDDEEQSGSGNAVLKTLTTETAITAGEKHGEQHFTQPPAHYTEATLVRALEEKGIGRPSTYAPIISTIQSRHYVTKEQKNIYITELGEVVNNLMKQAFPIIVDTDFTANLETLLDSVAEGELEWKTVIRNFYPDLDKAVREAEEELEHVKIEDEVSEEVCESCGRHMVIKYGPHGKFLACPGFPECRNTQPYYERTGISCPKCGGDIVLKRTRKGRRYYGCIAHPECDFMSWAKPVSKPCPVCGQYMVERGNKIVCSEPSCGYREAKTEENG